MEESVLPKRLFKPGSEPQVCQINNSCKMTLMTKIKNILPKEYNEVKMDPMFSHVLAIHDNVLGYSARLIHSMMCRQLVTRKGHELWCVFGGRPLRFSLQEFHAITGLKSINDGLNQDPEKWKDDNGFWGKILKKKEKISIKTILEKHLSHAKNWNCTDRLRLVYLCVIAGLVMARDEKKEIPHSYIKLVIDIELFKTYPWGIHSFDLLITSIIKTRDNLKNPKSYMLDGFSYAFQIWVMEAIPAIGTLLGNKVDVTLDHGPRCSNWKGASKVSYDDIIQLESTFTKTDVIYPYISIMGYNDVVHHIDFIWPDELDDDEVEKMNIFISDDYLFGEHIWESVTFGENCESINQELDEMSSSEDVADVPNLTDGLRISRKRIHDQGAEKRRKKMLWERATGKQGGVEEDMKLFLQEIFNEAFSSFASKLEKKIDERMEKIETKVSNLSNLLSAPEFHEDTSRTSKPPKTDNSRRHTRAEKSCGVSSTSLDDIFLSQPSSIDNNLGTQEYLEKTIGHLSQISHDTVFDPIKDYEVNEKTHCTTPKVGDKLARQLFTDTEVTDKKQNESEDHLLVFVAEKSFNSLLEWSKLKEKLMMGPSVVDNTLLTRIIGPKVWLGNEDIDALLYLFRENTSLRRWKYDRVGFMNCIFSIQMKTVYTIFSKKRRRFKWDDLTLAYGKGDLPSHGKTGQIWGTDVDRIYAPVFVNSNHWISVCINFVRRTIEVFDCSGKINNQNVEPFRVVIPYIVKAVQSPLKAKQLSVTPYSVIHTSMQRGINRSHCDCGVYSLKFIECHLRGLDFSLINDGNIGEARLKIAYDLWEAANDRILVERMSKFVPTKFDSDLVVID